MFPKGLYERSYSAQPAAVGTVSTSLGRKRPTEESYTWYFVLDKRMDDDVREDTEPLRTPGHQKAMLVFDEEAAMCLCSSNGISRTADTAQALFFLPTGWTEKGVLIKIHSP